MGSERLWDITAIVECIDDMPQTYKTLLAEDYSNGTCQTLVRKKLNRLVKEGDVCKTSIPGTRFGEAIFYTTPKKYYILVEAGRMGSRVYCFEDYKKIDRFFISVKKYWILKSNVWIRGYNKKFFEGKVLMLI